MVKLYKLEKVPSFKLFEGVKGRLIFGERMSLSFVEIEPNTTAPKHKHENEQITIAVEGNITFTVGDKEYYMKKGDVIVFGSNEVHQGVASEDGFQGIEIFAPLRRDHLKLVQQNS
ncbi:MAG: cupin domain-containing protein [Nitrososphaeria archaeon]|jgi:quercetin dioxygenase-like cupin family protein